MATDVKQEAFEKKRLSKMRHLFEMKREDPRRKNRDCKRKNGTEFGKKGHKNWSSPGSRSKSDHVQIAANRKKMNGPCDSVNDDKKMMPLAMNEIRNRTFANEIEEKKERIPLPENIICMCIPLRVDSIGVCIPLRKGCIVMCITLYKDCIDNSKKVCIPVSQDCISNKKCKLKKVKKLKLGFEKECTKVVAALNPVNENRLKLKQDGFEQGRVLERVAQTPLMLASTYGTHNSVSHRSNKNLNVQLHNENLVSAINENSKSADLNDKFL